jgi:L-alanine-DL-glutamate epimerase-like enolase superfamily enzyme
VTLRIRSETLVLALRDPFVIARSSHGEGRTSTTVVIEVEDDDYPGVVGIGEGYPDRFYGETPDTIAAVLPILAEAVGRPEPDAAWLVRAGEAMRRAIRWNGAAKCALDVALHDLVAKLTGMPVYRLLGLGRDVPPTDFTLGIDTPDVVAERARRAAHFPALKIKVGGPEDVATLEAVRGVYGGPIRVDANTAWEPEAAADLLPELERLGVELIEQPFPAHRLDQLRWLHERSPIPIVADESAVTIEDLDGLRGVVSGVNVKLAKCGGVGAAAAMLRRAHDLGFRTFLGCMEETSVGIAASAAVASLADWVDLDGNLLLAADPFEGLELDERCRWQLPEEPGLGVRRRSASD